MDEQQLENFRAFARDMAHQVSDLMSLTFAVPIPEEKIAKRVASIQRSAERVVA